LLLNHIKAFDIDKGFHLFVSSEKNLE